MKKILALFALALLVSSGGLYAQHYIGARGGVGAGFGAFNPRKDNQIIWGLPSGGVAWKYYSPEKYIGGIGAELEFFQRGYQYLEDSRATGAATDTTYYRRTINSVMLPVLWQSYINMIGNHFRVFLNLGVHLSYNISSHEYMYDHDMNVTYSGAYELQTLRDNRWGYGLTGGVGFNVMFGKFEAVAEGRFLYGYSDVMRNSSVYPTNPRSSPVHSINISVGLFYLLGDTPHSIQPGRRALERRQRKENERIMEEMTSED